MLPVEKNRWDPMMSLLESINHISYIALPLEYHVESKELDLYKEKEVCIFCLCFIVLLCVPNLIFKVEFPVLNIVGTFESLGSRIREIFGLSTEVLEEVVQNTLGNLQLCRGLFYLILVGSLCAVSTVYFNIDMDKEVAFMVDELLKYDQFFNYSNGLTTRLMSSNVSMNNHYLVTLRIILQNVSVAAVGTIIALRVRVKLLFIYIHIYEANC
jgi:hypothetical protein